MSTFYHIEPLTQTNPFNVNEREKRSGQQKQKKQKKKKKQPEPSSPTRDDSSEHNIDEFV